MPHAHKIQTADLDWQLVDGIEIPVSKQFGDVYFSKANGLLETRHVFLNGNDLPERLANLSPYQYFTVGETGFGTGLNFLALWQLWDEVKPDNHSWLHFVSVEKFPLSRSDLIRALAVWPELAAWSEQLIHEYPLPIAGCHRLSFPKARMSVDLWLGDAQDIFPHLQHQGQINAWFLDGFAPSCNPELWQANVIDHIIRLSSAGTTFASFSVAGVLKRGLKQHGVEIKRPKGFGHKREMLKGILPSVANAEPEENDCERTALTQSYAIVGAGIAGLCMAWALAARGYSVTLFDKTSPLAGGSGNPRALLNPKLCPIEQASEHLMTIAWQHAMRFYAKFKGAFFPLCIEQLALKKADELEALVQQYPDQILAHRVNSSLAADHAGICLKHAGSVSPHAFAELILKHPCIEYQQAEIQAINKQSSQWSLHSKTGIWQADEVIVACAHDTPSLIDDCPTLKPIRGQVSQIEFQHGLPVGTAYSYGGYALALNEHQLLIGASFKPNDATSDVTLADHEHNKALIQSIDPLFAAQLPSCDTWQGRAAVRAQTLDYFPTIGRQHNNAPYVLTGLGSKGFLFAPLLAELTCALLRDEALPISGNLMNKLNIQRFKKSPKPKKPYFIKQKMD